LIFFDGAMTRWHNGPIHLSLCYHPSLLEVYVSELSGFPVGLRRDEDIALDMMKFIAGTTGYGKTTGSAAGFQAGAVNKAEDYARHLLDLYGQCLTAVKAKK
jgi:hypothetical protein